MDGAKTDSNGAGSGGSLIINAGALRGHGTAQTNGGSANGTGKSHKHTCPLHCRNWFPLTKDTALHQTRIALAHFK